MLARKSVGKARQGLGLRIEAVVAMAQAEGLQFTPGRLRNIECGRTTPRSEERDFLSRLYKLPTFELFSEAKR